MRFTSCGFGVNTNDSLVSRVGEDGALERSVEGSIRMGERRGLLTSSTVLVGGETDFRLVSLKTSRPGAVGGGSKGIVLSVLVLVTRRKRGPLGLLVVGDCLVGDGGGSEARDGYPRYGCIELGIVTDTLRERRFPAAEPGLTPGLGARMRPWDWAGRCPSVIRRRRCERSKLSRNRSCALCCRVVHTCPTDAREVDSGNGAVTNGSFMVGGRTLAAC